MPLLAKDILQRLIGKTLDLSAINFTDDDIFALGELLRPDLTRFNEINLSNNQITDEGVSLLLKMFEEFDIFPRVTLVNNSISPASLDVFQRYTMIETELQQLCESIDDEIILYERPIENEPWYSEYKGRYEPDLTGKWPIKVIDMSNFLNCLKDDSHADTAIFELPTVKTVPVSFYDENKCGADNPYSTEDVTEILSIRTSDLLNVARALSRNTSLKSLNLFSPSPELIALGGLQLFTAMRFFWVGLKYTQAPLEILMLPNEDDVFDDPYSFGINKASLQELFRKNYTLRRLRLGRCRAHESHRLGDDLNRYNPQIDEENNKLWIDWESDNQEEESGWVSDNYFRKIYQLACRNFYSEYESDIISAQKGPRQWLDDYEASEQLPELCQVPDFSKDFIPDLEDNTELVKELCDEVNKDLKEKLQRVCDVDALIDLDGEGICILLTRNRIMQDLAHKMQEISYGLLAQDESPSAVLQRLTAFNMPASVVFCPFNDDQLKRIITVSVQSEVSEYGKDKILQYIIDGIWAGTEGSRALEIAERMLFNQQINAPAPNLDSKEQQPLGKKRRREQEMDGDDDAGRDAKKPRTDDGAHAPLNFFASAAAPAPMLKPKEELEASTCFQP